MICRPAQPAGGRPGPRRHGLLDDRAPASRSATSWPSSTPPAGSGPWSGTCTTGSTSTRCTATRRPTTLGLNDVGRVSLRVTQPLFYDSYRRNRATGSFILAAEDTNVDGRRRHAARPRLSRSAGCRRPTSPGTRAGHPRGAGPAAREPAAPPCGSPGCRARASRRWPPPSSSGWSHGGPGRLPARRRQPAHRAQRRPRLQPGRARGELPAGGRGGAAVRRRRPGGHRGHHQPLRRGRGSWPDGSTRQAGLPFVEVYMAAPVEVLRRARPEGPLRPGVGRGASTRSPGSTIPTRCRSPPTCSSVRRHRSTRPSTWSSECSIWPLPTDGAGQAPFKAASTMNW